MTICRGELVTVLLRVRLQASVHSRPARRALFPLHEGAAGLPVPGGGRLLPPLPVRRLHLREHRVRRPEGHRALRPPRQPAATPRGRRQDEAGGRLCAGEVGTGLGDPLGLESHHGHGPVDLTCMFWDCVEDAGELRGENLAYTARTSKPHAERSKGHRTRIQPTITLDYLKMY